MRIFKNAYYDKRTSLMHLWSQDVIESKDGNIEYENHYDVHRWCPYVYARVNESDIKSFEGVPVKKKHFNHFKEYKDFCANKKNRPICYENNIQPEIQFLVDKYYNIKDDEIKYPKLEVYFLDIETEYDNGYSRACEAKNRITLITVKKKSTKELITWGLCPYSGNREVDYNNFNNDEKSMLKDFVDFCHYNSPDVWTGWNVYTYDWQYIFMRLLYLFGDDEGNKLIKRLSPINESRYWRIDNKKAIVTYSQEAVLKNFQSQYLTDEDSDKTKEESLSQVLEYTEEDDIQDISFDIPGTVILDYMELYKQYRGKMRENYKLGNILIVEDIPCKKLDYVALGFKDLRDLQDRDWDTLCDYNMDDNNSLYDLDDKLDYISTALAICLYAKIPLKGYNSVSQINEGVILTYARRRNLCVPYFSTMSKIPFEAGWVKVPQKGQAQYFIDMDITSSYPTHIIVLNMSLETYYGRITGMTEHEIVDCVRNREFPEFHIMPKNKDNAFNVVSEEEKHIMRERIDTSNIKGSILVTGNDLINFNVALKRGLFAIAPIGSIFTTFKVGVLPDVQLQGFNLRVSVKEKMISMKNKAGKLEKQKKYDEAALAKIEQRKFNSLQTAIKLVLNGLYGCTSFNGSRYYNIWVASAITSCARHTIKQSERYINEILKKPNDELISIIESIKSHKA